MSEDEETALDKIRSRPAQIPLQAIGAHTGDTHPRGKGTLGGGVLDEIQVEIDDERTEHDPRHAAAHQDAPSAWQPTPEKRRAMVRFADDDMVKIGTTADGARFVGFESDLSTLGASGSLRVPTLDRPPPTPANRICAVLYRVMPWSNTLHVLSSEPLVLSRPSLCVLGACLSLLVCVLVGCFALGLYMLINCSMAMQMDSGSSDWTETTCIVRSVKTECCCCGSEGHFLCDFNVGRSAHSATLRESKAGCSTLYRAVFEVTLSVDGKRYDVSSGRYASGRWEPLDDVNEFVAGFTFGVAVPCWHHPDKPSLTKLANGSTTPSRVMYWPVVFMCMIIFACALCVCGLWLKARLFHAKHAPKPQVDIELPSIAPQSSMLRTPPRALGHSDRPPP